MLDQHRRIRRLVRLHEVMRHTGLSRATIYRMMAKKEFPSQILLTERNVGWDEDEIQDWIVTRLEAANKFVPEKGNKISF